MSERILAPPLRASSGKEATAMTCKATAHNAMHAMRLSGCSYYYFTKVCFAGLYFGSLNESNRSETPKKDF